MLFSKKTTAIGIFLMAFIIASCSDTNIDSFPQDNSKQQTLADAATGMNRAQARANLDLSSISSIHEINKTLAARGLNVRLAYAETVTFAEDGSDAIGQIIFANDRTKQLTAQWVPGDTRRDADGNNLNYLIFTPFALANGSIDSSPAIDASFETWRNINKMNKLTINKRQDTGTFPSAIFEGGDPFVADIVELGFFPGSLFDSVLGSGASSSVLGVTFTFIFGNVVEETFIPSDINNDGFADVALKEIWYNDAFLWKTEPSVEGVDIETVALHENGHALGFGHFGKVSVTAKNNKLHVSPRAVMNAIILGTQRDLMGTDEASFNSIYGNWPN